MLINNVNYSETKKTTNIIIISEMPIVFKEKTNQIRDEYIIRKPHR